MIYTFIAEQCGDLPTATCCRVLKVSRSGYYDCKDRPPSARDVADAALTEKIRAIHTMSRRSYGAPRIRAELRLGAGIRCSRKRVARLMRAAGIVGIHKRRKRGCTRSDPDAAKAQDLVRRDFTADGPDRLWVTDVTEHPTGEGKVYLAAVLDVWSRRAVGWAIADHMRTELVMDALQMALWRRHPTGTETTVVHSDHGSQYTSWAFGRRLRDAGLLGSMGSIGDCYDNCLVESFFGTLQRELLDEAHWTTRDQLATAIFEWIEAWYNPTRRHSSINMLSPIDYETTHAA